MLKFTMKILGISLFFFFYIPNPTFHFFFFNMHGDSKKNSKIIELPCYLIL